MKSLSIIFGIVAMTTSISSSIAQETQSPVFAPLDHVVPLALQQFHTPGMAVGIIVDNKVQFLKGYGQRTVSPEQDVTAGTYFRLGSTSKAFTAAALAIAIEEFELDWNTPVVDILPDFAMQDPWVTREFKLVDLLAHRSGLAGGAGDSMLWPEPSGFSRSEIIHNLRFLTPTSSFRSQYGYSNLTFITAGEIVAKLYNKPFASVVQEKLFAPLNMKCFAGEVPMPALNNVAMSYGYNDKRGVYAIPRNSIEGRELVSAAAGGIVCNATEMLKWLAMWLNDGKATNNTQVLTTAQIDFMHKAHTVLPLSKNDVEWNQTQFKSYGLGWRLSNMNGVKLISHTGTLSGYQANVAMIPSMKVGIVLLNNGSNSGARGAVMQTLLKAFISPNDNTDWVAVYTDYQAKRERDYLANNPAPTGTGEVILDPLAYAGTFEDKWFGKLTLELNSDGVLRIRADKMPMLTGYLSPFSDHTFVIHWDNPNAANDAFIHFDVNTARQVTGFSLYPFTSKLKENHEYRDMYFSAKIPKTD